MSLNQNNNGDRQVASLPLFQGLETLALNGQDIAEIVGVSPSTVSKWRNGHVAVPAEIVTFLTLVLASLVEDVLDGAAMEGDSPELSFHQRAALVSAREDLAAQEKINHNLQPIAVRDGAIKFRYWWNKQTRTRLPAAAMGSGRAEQAAPLV